jgi:hypothetical protein
VYSIVLLVGRSVGRSTVGAKIIMFSFFLCLLCRLLLLLPTSPVGVCVCVCECCAASTAGAPVLARARHSRKQAGSCLFLPPPAAAASAAATLTATNQPASRRCALSEPQNSTQSLSCVNMNTTTRPRQYEDSSGRRSRGMMVMVSTGGGLCARISGRRILDL